MSCHKCPKCSSDDVWEVIGSCPWSEAETKGKRIIEAYPIRPAEAFECQKCGNRWENPEFEKYLLSRVIKI